MDIRQLNYFVGIAECGSMMKAAERLHVAQPALSVQMSSLEAQLGVTLMRRSSRGVELTEAGRALYERATQLLRYHRDTIDLIKAQTLRASGSVSLGMPSSSASLLTPAILQRLRSELPDVSLYVAEASSAMLYEWLVDGRLDLAFMFSVPEDPQLECTPLRSEQFCLVSRADGRRYRATVDFDSLFDLPLVLASPSTTWRKITDAVAERRGRRLVSVMETESAAVIRAVAAAGIAFGLLPASFVHEDRKNGTLRVQRVVKPAIRGVLSLARLRASPITPASKAVLDRIVDVVRSTKIAGDDEVRLDTTRAASVLRALPGKVLPTGR